MYVLESDLILRVKKNYCALLQNEGTIISTMMPAVTGPGGNGGVLLRTAGTMPGEGGGLTEHCMGHTGEVPLPFSCASSLWGGSRRMLLATSKGRRDAKYLKKPRPLLFCKTRNLTKIGRFYSGHCIS